MKYFVTGATGFIGGRVARRLLAAGHTVTILARDPAKAADLAALGAKARRDLGYDPRSLVEGLRETLAFDMQRLGLPAPAAAR